LSPQAEAFFTAQLKGEQPPSRATMELLYGLAAKIAERHPWKRLADTALVLVEGLLPGDLSYCSFMGALGQVFSMHAYVGREGLRGFRKIERGDPITAGELWAQTRCLFIEFVRPGGLTAPDRVVLRSLGHPVRPGVWSPIYRSIRRGYHPWYITNEEGILLAKCAEAALGFLDVMEREPKNYWDSPDRYPVVVQDGGKAGGYEVRAVRLPAAEEPIPVIPNLDSTRVGRILAEGLPRRGVLQLGQIYGAAGIGKKNERKACFRAVVAIDAETGFAHRPSALAPECSDGEALLEGIYGAVEGSRMLPVTIQVGNAESKLLLEPLARALGIGVEVRKALPAFEMARRSMLEMFGDAGSIVEPEAARE